MSDMKPGENELRRHSMATTGSSEWTQHTLSTDRIRRDNQPQQPGHSQNQNQNQGETLIGGDNKQGGHAFSPIESLDQPFNHYYPTDIYSSTSPFATYYQGVNDPSPMTHQHTGPAAFTSNSRRTVSPMLGHNSLFPSYGSAPSPSIMPVAFSDFQLPSSSRCPPVSNLINQTLSNQNNSPVYSTTGTSIVAAGGFDGLNSQSGFGGMNSSAFQHHRSTSSPGPGSPTSHPGSISPPFSAVDTSPPTSISAGSRGRNLAQESPTANPKFISPSSIYSSGASGPGVGLIHGYAFLFDEGQRGSDDPSGGIKDDDEDGMSDVGRNEDGKGNAESGPARRPRDEVRMDARRARIESEQKRRDELREGFKKLKDALPTSGQRASKASLLDRAITHVSQVEAANRYLHESNQRLLAENEKLRDSNHKLVAAQARVRGNARQDSDSPIK